MMDVVSVGDRPANPCRICYEIGADGRSLMSRTLPPGVNNLIREVGSDLAIIPSLGPLTGDHRLLVTCDHRTGLLGTAPPSAIRRLVEVLRNESTKVEGSRLGGAMLAFEHGSHAPQAQPPCSTEHAHVHLLSVPVRVAQEAVERVANPVEIRTDGDWLRALKQLEPEYVAMIASDDYFATARLGHASSAGLESQHLRRLVADLLGNSHWDWREDPGSQLHTWLADPAWKRNIDLRVKAATL